LAAFRLLFHCSIEFRCGLVPTAKRLQLIFRQLALLQPKCNADSMVRNRAERLIKNLRYAAGYNVDYVTTKNWKA
jgi:hypothetical protein